MDSSHGRRASTTVRSSLWALLTFAAATEAAAQIGIAVEGQVVDAVSEQPVAQALVLAITESGDTLFYSQTNETGLYFIPRQEPETRYRIAVEALGFSREIGDVLTGQDEPQYWVIRLDPEPITREELVVEVERQDFGLRQLGFYQRRDRRNAVFVDVAVMERTTVPTLGDVLRRSPGIRVTTVGEPYSTRSGACLPTVFVDDTLVRQGGDPVPPGRNPDLLEFVAPPPSQVAGMEFYHGGSSIPPAYAGTNTSCGVLLVWTRR